MTAVVLAFALAVTFAAAVVAAYGWHVVGKLRAEVRQLREGHSDDPEIDPLTGAANWAGLMTHLRRARSRQSDSREDIGVIAFDLVSFSAFNASLGRAAGDQALTTIAGRLAGAVRTGELLARTSGAHFVVALEAPVSHYGARRAATRLLETIRRPLDIEGEEIVVDARAGIATGPRDRAEDLVENAQAALMTARRDGSRHPVLFDDSVRHDTARSFHQAQQLKTAAAAGELYLAYQPIHRTEDGALSGVEALLRWDSRTFGPVSPADFIPIAEDTGTIIEIGAWVLEAACHDLQAFDACGHEVSMSVNVSAHQLQAPGFCDTVEAVIHDTGIAPERLQLELTESVLAQPEEVEALLERLRRSGVKIALDDVGTGYSSLSQVAAIPVDAIKLDRSLIARFGRSSGAAERVFTSLVALGRSLDLDVVAEGIETEQQARFAHDAGCTHEQGFLYSRPEKLEQVLDYAATLAVATSLD